METQILKIIICSSIFIALYFLFLEREKIFKFNRFYLLASLVFSYTVPFISITVPNFEKPKPQIIFEDSVQQIIVLNTEKPQESFNWENLIWVIYFSVTTFLLVKSLFSVFKILSLKGKIRIINFQKIKIVEKDISPFSFLNTIYIGKKYFENEKLDERILLHETNHVKQKHSLDLIFVEVLKIFSWFNPAIYFYKNALITNHEFLADEEVLKQNFNIKNYQTLILSEISNHQKNNLTHQFNFYNTKKRFIMMTTPKNKKSKMMMWISIPLALSLFFAFAEKNPEQKENFNLQKTKAETAIPIGDNYEGSSKVHKNGQNVNNSQVDLETQKYFDKHNNMQSTQIGIKQPLDTLNKSKKIETNLISTPLSNKQSGKTQNLENQSVAPQFPGGLSVLRMKVLEHFDVSVYANQKKPLKSYVRFIVDRNGIATEFSAEGGDAQFNQESLRAVQKIATSETWTPATKDGVSVDYNLKIPLTMDFTNFSGK